MLQAYRVGRAAYEAGQDVQAAIVLAGFSAQIARSTFNKLSEQMPATKRARTSAPASAPVAKNVRTYVNKCMKKMIENKYHVLSAATLTPTTSGLMIGAGVEAIVQGTGDEDRIGNNIRLKYITVRGEVSDGTISPGPFPSGWVRLAIVYDRQSNGAVPAVADLLEPGVSSPYAPFNHDLVSGAGGARFQILKQKYIKYQSISESSGDAARPLLPFTITASLKGKLVRYNGSTSTFADVQQGGLFLLALASNNSLRTYTVFDVGFEDA